MDTYFDFLPTKLLMTEYYKIHSHIQTHLTPNKALDQEGANSLGAKRVALVLAMAGDGIPSLHASWPGREEEIDRLYSLLVEVRELLLLLHC